MGVGEGEGPVRVLVEVGRTVAAALVGGTGVDVTTRRGWLVDTPAGRIRVQAASRPRPSGSAVKASRVYLVIAVGGLCPGAPSERGNHSTGRPWFGTGKGVLPAGTGPQCCATALVGALGHQVPGTSEVPGTVFS